MNRSALVTGFDPLVELDTMNHSSDTTSLVVRDARDTDATALLRLFLEMEARFDLLYEPGERQDDPQLVARAIAEFATRPNCRYLVAESCGEIVGWLTLEGGRPRRRSRAAYLIISVRADRQGSGVGSALLREAMAWAEAAGLMRVELIVLVTNPEARLLYERFGFETEGLLRRYLVIRGEPVDANLMARLIP